MIELLLEVFLNLFANQLGELGRLQFFMQVLLSLAFQVGVVFLWLENASNPLPFELYQPIVTNLLIHIFSEGWDVIATVSVVDLIGVQKSNNFHLPELPMVVLEESSV